MFKRDAEQAEIWITMRESLLGSDDIGVSDIILPQIFPLNLSHVPVPLLLGHIGQLSYHNSRVVYIRHLQIVA